MLAVPLWAAWPLLASLTTTAMPLFEYLTMIFGAGAVLLLALQQRKSACVVDRRSTAGRFGSTWLSVSMVAIGLLGSTILFIMALRYIPAAQANLLLYLWPVMVVLIASGLQLVKLKVHRVLGVILGLIGAAFVIGGSLEGLSWTGVALAAAGGFVWAVFVVFRLWQGDRAPDALGWGLFTSAAISVALHLLLEHWVTPSMSVLVGTLLVGIVPLALGNLAWDHGVRKGNRVLLATLAYATPLVSALLLVGADLAAPSLSLLTGAALIVTAGVVAGR
jgi:drug/metabolite transporter (DMT)-like permease